MTTTEFSLGGTLIVVSRLGPEMVGLTVHGTAEDGSGAMLLCLTASREECEVGTGFAPWPEEQLTMRIGPAVVPLAGEIEAAQVEAVIRDGWLQ